MSWKPRLLTLATSWLLLALLATLAAVPVLGQQPGRIQVFIAFAHQPGPAEQALVHRAGGSIQYTYHLVPAIAATIPETAIRGLLRSPGVVRVEPVIEVHAIDAELDNTWGVQRIGAGIAHAAGNMGAGVKVAVIDSGIDCTHPDLASNCAGGYDFVNEDADPTDDAGHGTHVAGTIAAADNDAGVVGVAPAADLFALKVLNASGSGTFADVVAALDWAVNHGIQVTNNSYGSSIDPGTTVRNAFDEAYAAGIVNVCSAGNEGTPPGKGDSVGYPAKYASCIAVAATDASDLRARFSSTGPDVELSAPGVGIVSTVPEGGYASWSGTSMASPHVAGTAALIIASGITGPDNVRQRLIETADDLGVAGRDSWYGYGLVDAGEAAGGGSVVPNSPPSVSITSPSDGSSFDSGASIGFTAAASDPEDGDLSGALTWTSSLDGLIGTGGSFSAVLRDGHHVITASATDSGGQTATDSVAIDVGAPQGTMHVGGLTGSTATNRNRWAATVTVTVHDAAHGAVPNATVYGTWSGGAVGSASCTTGAGGQCSITSGSVNKNVTSITFTVDNVTHSALAYDPAGNEAGPSITVSP